MADQFDMNRERISALVDGQLRQDELDWTLDELASSAQARVDWDTFHVVGDIMRMGDLPAQAHDEKFLLKLRQRMHEPTVENNAVPAMTIGQIREIGHKSSSANDGSWRRVVGLASVVLAGVLVWQLLPLANPVVNSPLAQPNANTLAAQTASVAPQDLGSAPVAHSAMAPQSGGELPKGSESPGIMIRDARLDAILAAHRQFGAISALPMPAGFVRSAVLDEGAR